MEASGQSTSAEKAANAAQTSLRSSLSSPGGNVREPASIGHRDMKIATIIIILAVM
jgi:hypothetical protein